MDDPWADAFPSMISVNAPVTCLFDGKDKNCYTWALSECCKLVYVQNGIDDFLTCMIPQYFSKTGRVAFIAGLINSCTYLGSALSGYGFAALAAFIGWGGTIVGWAIICALACIICLALCGKWKKYKEQ